MEWIVQPFDGFDTLDMTFGVHCSEFCDCNAGLVSCTCPGGLVVIK